MSEAALDPYAVLGVARDVSDIELRRAYKALVKRYHPDHNGGSAESAAHFAQIHKAYDEIAFHRRPGPSSSPPPGAGQRAAGSGPMKAGSGPMAAGPGPMAAHPGSSAAGQAGPGAGEAGIEERLASLERELAVIRAAERLRAQEPTRPAPRRPTPEELGYYTTEDSLTKIIDDAADSLAQRLDRSDTKRQFTRRLSDLLGRDD